MIIHLTLTGYDAGRPLCDCDRSAPENKGAKYMHAIYAPVAVFSDPLLCSACKKVWDECDDETAE